MKKSGWFWGLIIILMIATLCNLVNHFVSLPDWLVITSGILTILSLPVISYKVVRTHIERSK